MILHKYITLAALALPLSVAAQSIGFEKDGEYSKLGVYDTWEASPFRTGALQGNVAVVKNHLADAVDPITKQPVNSSEHILGIQRSRFGSNTFGGRIDLSPENRFELTPQNKYVHVLMHKPDAGRVMLIGLGKRRDRSGQSEDVEQFWVFSTTEVMTDQWFDAVFPVKGNGGIDIYSLVIVPDASSPHDRTSDFACFVDDIVVNNSPKARVFDGNYYTVAFNKNAVSEKSDRYISNITLAGSADGEQTLTVGLKSPNVMYRDHLNHIFTAKAGEKLTPTFGYNASWMNGYVYLDRGKDGEFQATINDDYTIAEKSDIMTYAYEEVVENTSGYNCLGQALTGEKRNVLNPPAFNLPSDLKEGFYRMRFKVDWGSIDPAASKVTASNSITKNGGMIVDALMNIHGDKVKISRSGGLNGQLNQEGGQELNGQVEVDFGKDFKVIAEPAPDFTFDYLDIKYGYNLDSDSLKFQTPQWFTVRIPASEFKDNTYTIPAKYLQGEVRLTPQFKNPSGGSTDPEAYPEDAAEDYVLNFDKQLSVTRTDRVLQGVTFTCTKGGDNTINVPEDGKQPVYRRMVEEQPMSILVDDEISPVINYKGNAMHGYVYVDWNQDGKFNYDVTDGNVPTENSELVSFSHYQGHNSKGETTNQGQSAWQNLPSFKVPDFVTPGVYRARIKLDWNNIDPAGQWAEGSNKNQIDANGGYIMDFLLNVHNEKGKLDIQTVDGSIVGKDNSGLDETVTYGASLDLTAVPAAPGYEAKNFVVRHGQNLDGAAYIHANRQWNEYTAEYAEALNIPEENVDGDLRIKAEFKAGDSEYKLVFGDEFNSEDSAVDTEKWSHSPVGHGITWKRFVAQTPEGRALTAFQKDGKLVTRCLPNTLEEEKDQSGNKQQMISGSIESQGKFDFTYGKVEARLKTTPHTGNFPAFWMMPLDGTGGWPACGEIDIWEQIDDQEKSVHTIHTAWSKDHPNDPVYSAQADTKNGQYHTFGLEWSENDLKWYRDGKLIFTYAKSNDENKLAQGQWPFDKHFYLILNQSVGNGSWAKPADTSFTYETLFDWVRVYQKNGQVNTGINGLIDAQSEMSITTFPGKLYIVSPAVQQVSVIDLQGRLVYQASLQGNKTISLPKGVYIVNGKKVLVP